MTDTCPRRRYLQTTGLALAAVAGCVSSDGSGPDASSPTEASQRATATAECTVSQETELTTLLPPAPDGLDRHVDAEVSDAYLDQYEATASVSADYVDGDDEVLDDLSVRVFRFREDADPERVLNDQVNAVRGGSRRVAVTVLIDEVGLVGIAPERSRAERLLANGPALPPGCVEAGLLNPTASWTPDDGDGTPRSTATGHE